MQTFRCKELAKSFDGVHALLGASLEFPTSGIVAIIGPNGAGKTTLLNILTGFLKPDAGQSFLGEVETTRMAAHRIARLGIARTFQDLRLISEIAVVENVQLAQPKQRGERLLPALFGLGVALEESRNRDEAMRLLGFVGLAEKAGELAGKLSYGQQKLLTLACCLAAKADVLFLDEPVAGVHPEMIEKILDLLLELRRMNKLVVFVEHDIAAVRKVADVVIVMDDGRIIAQGKPSDVLERPEIIEAYVN
jgi:ABC-type branched-subunit amino acid transport system ATPase component